VANGARVYCRVNNVVLTHKKTNTASLDLIHAGRQGILTNEVSYNFSECMLRDIEQQMDLFNEFGGMVWFTGQPSRRNMVYVRDFKLSDNMKTLLAHLADMLECIAQPRPKNQTSLPMMSHQTFQSGQSGQTGQTGRTGIGSGGSGILARSGGLSTPGGLANSAYASGSSGSSSSASNRGASASRKYTIPDDSSTEEDKSDDASPDV
jgi:hypothetical protein